MVSPFMFVLPQYPLNVYSIYQRKDMIAMNVEIGLNNHGIFLVFTNFTAIYLKIVHSHQLTIFFKFYHVISMVSPLFIHESRAPKRCTGL